MGGWNDVKVDLFECSHRLVMDSSEIPGSATPGIGCVPMNGVAEGHKSYDNSGLF